MTDTQILDQVKMYFDLTHAPTPWFWQWADMLDDYRKRKAAGQSKTVIVNAWKDSYQPTTAAAFVNAMDQIERGIPIQDPNERPSWAEAYDMGLGPIVKPLPWGKILLVGGAALAIWGFSTRAGQSFFKTKVEKER